MCGGFKFNEFQADCLEAHNDYRVRHGSGRLNLDKGLCKFAQDWANYLRDCDILKPAKTCEYGENIFFKASERKVYPDAYEPVRQWYNEGRNFDPKKTYPVKDIKHFSQVVWKNTKALGVAYALNEYVSLSLFALTLLFTHTFFQRIHEDLRGRLLLPSRKRLQALLRQREAAAAELQRFALHHVHRVKF